MHITSSTSKFGYIIFLNELFYREEKALTMIGYGLPAKRERIKNHSSLRMALLQYLLKILIDILIVQFHLPPHN
jgi:hypothetical protein